jgi:hypothetical protein
VRRKVKEVKAGEASSDCNRYVGNVFDGKQKDPGYDEEG